MVCLDFPRPVRLVTASGAAVLFGLSRTVIPGGGFQQWRLRHVVMAVGRAKNGKSRTTGD
jgi:hypothetical protein